MSSNGSTRLAAWHEVVVGQDRAALADFLNEEVQLYSPIYWRPREGRQTVAHILSTVIELLEEFRYEREWVDGHRWALEFSARIGDLAVKGVDLIELDESGRIATIEVLMRPASALQAFAVEMNRRLTDAPDATSRPS